MIWRSLIVDDEPPARRRLRRLLESHANVQVVGEAASVTAAVELLRGTSIDLIFLDIQMPGETGFALWERVDVGARVVFVTAFDHYAVRAFEHGAVDYLLKPIDPVRLEMTLGRLPTAPADAERPGADDRIVCLSAGSRYRIARVRDIVCVEAQGDYSLVRLRDGDEVLVAVSMKSWVARLPAELFTQVHRSTVVRLELVERIEPRGSAWVAKVRGLQRPIDVSRAHLRRLRDRLRPRAC
jgi:two-component system LytT family response regulator